ncbi:MAG: hypothetical protein U1E65_09225 [Myxococcota bacterium]
MSRWLLLCWLPLGCLAPTTLEFSPGAAVQTILIVEPAVGETPAAVFAMANDGALLMAAHRPGTLIFTFDQPPEALGLGATPVSVDLLRGVRAEVPRPLGRYLLDGSGAQLTETSTAGLILPPLDLEAIYQAGGCLGADAYLWKGSACGSQSPLGEGFVATAAFPTLVGPAGCPGGFRAMTRMLERGGALEPDPLPYCQRPAPLACATDEIQVGSAPGCHRVGSPCPAGGAFSSSLPPGRSIRYVRPGAAAGDGSEARPFGTLAEAIAASSGLVQPLIALAPGRYAEPLQAQADLEVVGACAGGTVISGPIGVQNTALHLRDLGLVGAPITVAGGSVLLDAVIAVPLPLASETVLTVDDASLHIRGSRIGADVPAWAKLNNATMILDDSAWFGRLSATTSSLAIHGSVLTSTAINYGLRAGDSTITISASSLNLVLKQRGGKLDILDSAIDLGPAQAPSGINGLEVTDTVARIRRSTFTSTTIVVSKEHEQVSISSFGGSLELEDLFFELADDRADSWVVAVVAENAASPSTASVGRVVVAGATRTCALCMASDQAELHDLRFYGGQGHGLIFSGRQGLVQRVAAYLGEGTLSAAGIRPWPISLQVEEVRSVNQRGPAVNIQSSARPMDVRLDGLEIVGVESHGLVLRGDLDTSQPPVEQGRLQVRARRVWVDVGTPNAATIYRDVDLELTDFLVRSGASAMLLKPAVPENRALPIHLRSGSFDAPTSGVYFASGVAVPLSDLFDRSLVRARAPVTYAP